MADPPWPPASPCPASLLPAPSLLPVSGLLSLVSAPSAAASLLAVFGFGCASAAPVGVSHSITRLSIPAVANRVPECENVTKWIRRWCPVKTPTSLRLATSQSLTILSRPTPASNLPSGENAAKRTQRVAPRKGSNSLRVATSQICTLLLAPAEARSLPSGENATE